MNQDLAIYNFADAELEEMDAYLNDFKFKKNFEPTQRLASNTKLRTDALIS